MFVTIVMEIGKKYRVITAQGAVFEGNYTGLEYKGAGIGWEMLFGDKRFSGNNIKGVQCLDAEL